MLEKIAREINTSISIEDISIPNHSLPFRFVFSEADTPPQRKEGRVEKGDKIYGNRETDSGGGGVGKKKEKKLRKKVDMDI